MAKAIANKIAPLGFIVRPKAPVELNFPQPADGRKSLGDWEATALQDQPSVWASVNGSRIFCEIPRSTIQEVPRFGDAIPREITRDRAEIFDRLRPAVVAKIARTRDSSIRLHPSDLS